MRYKAFLLDLYGTLVDIRTDESRFSLWKKTAEYYSRNGAVWTAAALRAAYCSETARMERESTALFPEIDLRLVFQSLYRMRGVEASDEQVARTAWAFRTQSTRHIRLYAGVRELLRALRRTGKVILLSNAQRLFTAPELEMLGISDLFDGVFLSSDFGCKKPDPSFFSVPLDRFGLDPSSCLMIGNDPICDIIGAHEAGMHAYYIHSALSPREGKQSVLAEYSQDKMDLQHTRRVLEYIS